MHLQQVTPIGLSGNNNNNNKKNISFQCWAILEGGGSNKKTGSLKERFLTNSGQDLFSRTGVINDEDPKGFHGNSHFNKLIAKAANIGERLEDDIKKLQAQLDENHMLPEEKQKLETKLAETKANLNIWNKLPEEEKPISKLVLLLPGTLRSKKALFMRNLLKTNGESLTDVNLGEIVTDIKKQGKIQLTSDFDTRKDFIPLKDLGATGVGIAKKIKDHPIYGKRFTKGFFATAIHPGGGFGAADIRVKRGGKVAIQTNESGHDYYYDPKTGKEIRLGKMGVSVGSAIENFATKLGVDPDGVKALMATGNAQMTTQKQFKLKTKNDDEAINALLKTEAYEIVSKNSESTILKVKSSEIQRFEQASKEAAESFAYALSRHAIAKINQGANLYNISGPLGMGINNRIAENPGLFGGAKNLPELITRMIASKNDETCNDLIKSNKFIITCEEALNISDNTLGGAIMAADKNLSFERRGEWVEISMKALKSIKHAV